MDNNKIKIKPLKGKRWKLLNIPFPDADLRNTFLTFGRSIYCALQITEDLLVHEKVHVKQQKGSYFYAIFWWVKYIFLSDFRYKQEIEAYGAQYKFLCGKYKDRNQQNRFLREIADILASSRYKNIVTFEQAMTDLQRYNPR